MPTTTPLPPEKTDESEMVTVETGLPVPVDVDPTDEVPEGGYGWICVFAVGTVNCFVWVRVLPLVAETILILTHNRVWSVDFLCDMYTHFTIST